MSLAKKIVAVVSDLMFTVKIQEAAKRAGVEAVFVKSENEAVAEAKQNPAVIILDLNNSTLNALDVIAKLKNDEATSNVKLLGFVSHVQADLKEAAEDKGCDVVMPRSAFSHNLAAILRRYAEA
ncbi:MAG: response regulator [Bryobacteraceae bacterium]|jgi:CheY-like chemotaxis protein